MLGLQYVMAKSKELTSRLDLAASSSSTGSAGASASASAAAEPTLMTAPRCASPTAARNEGAAFLTLQRRGWHRVQTQHERLLASGEELAARLAATRQRLLDEAESEAFVTRHFDELAHVRERLSHMRALVDKIVDDAQDVEHLLMQRTEEYMAAQNASFVTQQEQELERFEARILDEKEERKRELLAARRQALADAFHRDLQTYQSLTSAAPRSSTPHREQVETLESIDLVVTTDATQLAAFYEESSATDGDTDAEGDMARVLAREEEETKDEDHEKEELVSKSADLKSEPAIEATNNEPSTSDSSTKEAEIEADSVTTTTASPSVEAEVEVDSVTTTPSPSVQEE